MQQHVHTRADVQVTELQCPRQGNDQRRIYLAQAALSICLILCPLFKLVFQYRRWERCRGYSACQWRIVVDVELEEMEERIVDEIDGAIDVLFYSKYQLEGSSSFITREGGNVGELAGCLVGDVFASVTVRCVRWQSQTQFQAVEPYIVRFRQLTGMLSPTRYPGPGC